VLPFDDVCLDGLIIGDARRDAARMIRDGHYTKSVPSGKSHYVRFEDAIVVWSLPANMHLARYVLQFDGVLWELSRLWAPDGHEANLLTRAISYAARTLRTVEKPDALVSYADPSAGHHGGVYRAASWRFHGQAEDGRAWRGPDGAIVARRAFHSGKSFLRKPEIEALGFTQAVVPGKLRFVKPLTRQAKRSIVWPPADVAQ
jgi:hypothetical protein